MIFHFKKLKPDSYRSHETGLYFIFKSPVFFVTHCNPIFGSTSQILHAKQVILFYLIYYLRLSIQFWIGMLKNIFKFSRYVKGWNEFVMAVHLFMQTKMKKGNVELIDKKLRNFIIIYQSKLTLLIYLKVFKIILIKYL